MVKHLGKDSIEPKLIPGKYQFYTMRYCPYAQRVQLVLNAKKIPHDPVFINLTEKPEWYLKMFPAGKVPALTYEGKFLSESLLLADFLDEQHTQIPLWSNSPLQKILDKIFIESFGKVASSFYKFMMTGSKLEKNNFDELVEYIKLIESELKIRSTKYFGGESPKMVDYMIWPWFERIDCIGIFSKNLFIFPFDKFPKLAEWRNAMITDEAVASYYLSPEKHAQHFINRKAGLPAAFDF
ncbi:pyrimidodiazepine synthase-like [Daktulosphaira vitifoliae]|uniref:Glutathione-dependent dehydroascorbate reductase n=1 Tax=Daktulosphaira vitifoliae TaxID=58002 RepID=A0A2I6QGR0_DAKVI|nr:pyrimidodiazepine synthase-like [Daktulosphaira vitifoliae]AUN35385.1 glutathione S-transferase o1 [Daktulosphaira vitifoliae]